MSAPARPAGRTRRCPAVLAARSACPGWSTCTCTSCRRGCWPRSGPTSTRPRSTTAAAWPIVYRGTRRGADRAAARLRASGRSRRWRTRTSRAWPRFLNDWTLDFAAATPDCVPSATFFPEPAAGGVRPGRAGRGAPGCSRRTCRSAATTRTTRCSTRSGARWPRPARRWWCTAATARVPGRAHRGRADGAGAAPAPGAGAGRRARRHAGLPGLRRARRPATRGCTWTPRCSAPPFTEADGADAAPAAGPAGRPGRPGACSAPTSRTSRTRT